LWSKKKKQLKEWEWEWNLLGKFFTEGESKKKATLKIILDYKKIKWEWNWKKNIIQWIITKKNYNEKVGTK